MAEPKLEINVELESRRVEALMNQDAEIYVILCDKAGLCEKDIEDIHLYGLKNVDEVYRKSLLKRKVAKKRTKKKQIEHDQLRVCARRENVNVDNVFVDTRIKIRHLRDIMGYNGLYVRKGEKIALDDAKPTRIGEVYKKCYYQGEEQ